MAALEATFFVFLIRLFPFHLFTINVTRALPLETIKGETGATSTDEHTHLAKTNTHTHTSLRRTHTPG
jgi:hypothetical protein